MTDSRSELPAAALEAGANAFRLLRGALIYRESGSPYDLTVARAVLVAATERVKCQTCDGVGADDYCDPNGEPNPSLCPACAGTGFLYVLKRESE